MNNFNINRNVNPKGLQKEAYDVIIIGAGIGGLTCGCYLAKAGMKVLIVEQHRKAGGYCTSFKRKGFTFDAAAHYLGGLREGGPLRNIYNDLNLCNKVEIMRFDPTDIVILPEYKIHIRADMYATISELQENFRHEAENIENFFKFIWNTEFADLYSQLRNKTFNDFLNIYFKDHQIKSILAVFLGNIGLPPSRVSALASAILFREFVMDGGYYPKGGMQAFPDAFVERFIEWGGEIIFREKVEKIILQNQRIKGIVIDKNNFIPSKTVVSNCDAANTFIQLIGKEYLPADFTAKITNLEITPSAFIVYLGLNKSYSDILKNRCSWWCFFNTRVNVEKIYLDLDRKEKPYAEDGFFCFFPSSHDLSLAPPDNEVIILLIPAKMTGSNFWQKNSHNLAYELIKKAEKIIPDLSNSVVVKEIATPLTLHRYTSNANGASYGWASTPLQIDSKTMPPTTFIEGLYLAGHWATLGIGPGGISTVAYCGKNVAKLIIKGLKFRGK
jgi:phytoene dehydrogenase-like protein